MRTIEGVSLAHYLMRALMNSLVTLKLDFEAKVSVIASVSASIYHREECKTSLPYGCKSSSAS
jgi:hypothetical protein